MKSHDVSGDGYRELVMACRERAISRRKPVMVTMDITARLQKLRGERERLAQLIRGGADDAQRASRIELLALLDTKISRMEPAK